MFGSNGYKGRQYTGLFFVLIDCLLVFGGVLAATYVRFWTNSGYFFEGEYPILKIMVIVLVIQVCFYYSDLYNPKIFREKKALIIFATASLGVSAIILAITYFLFPLLSIGRGVFVIGFCFVFLLAVFLRIGYGCVTRSVSSRERILIIGTGELARRIKQEILDNGNNAFEIIGFVDEDRENLGQPI